MWTPRQQEIAAMLREGKPQKDIIAAGYGKTNISKVRTALRAEQQKEEEAKKAKETPGGAGLPGSAHETRIRPRTLEALEVGALIIEPADWRINQYGGFLIMNTYEMARQRYGYEGTVGEFICDAIQTLRTIMGMEIMPFQYLQEVGDNGSTGEEASQRGGVSAAAGEEPGGEPEPAVT